MALSKNNKRGLAVLGSLAALTCFFMLFGETFNKSIGIALSIVAVYVAFDTLHTLEVGMHHANLRIEHLQAEVRRLKEAAGLSYPGEE